MVFANYKGKKPKEDDPQNPKEEDILVGDEEDMEEDEHPDIRAIVASIGVVANPARTMSIGGKPPHHCSYPWSLPPRTKNPFHTLIHEHQYQNMPKEKLPSNWDLPRSSHAGKEDFKEEVWGKNSKS